MAAATSLVSRLNPNAQEFIPSRYTIARVSTNNESVYTPFSSTPAPPPNNPSSSFYYYPTHQTPPPPPQQPPQFLSEPHPYYSNIYPTNDPFLLTQPQPQTLSPIPTPPHNFPVTGEMVVFDRRNSRRSSNKGRGVLGSYGNQNDCSNKLAAACNDGSSSSSSRFCGGGGGGCGNEKFGRVVKYEESVKKGKRFDVVSLHSDGRLTTVMIRNIPSKYTRKMLLHFLEKHCLKENEKETLKINSGESGEETRIWSAIDFLYLPIDFRSGWNKGYAFVNFTDARAVWKFFNVCHNQKWEFFHSNKISEIACAKIQGKKALIEHFEHTAFACDSDECLPVCFSSPRDGSNESLAESSMVVVGKRIPTRRY